MCNTHHRDLLLFSTSIIASRLGPAKPRAIAWNGAGGCVIELAGPATELLSHMLGHEPLPGMTSSVSVTSSPILESLLPPQHRHDVGAG